MIKQGGLRLILKKQGDVFAEVGSSIYNFDTSLSDVDLKGSVGFEFTAARPVEWEISEMKNAFRRLFYAFCETEIFKKTSSMIEDNSTFFDIKSSEATALIVPQSKMKVQNVED